MTSRAASGSPAAPGSLAGKGLRVGLLGTGEQAAQHAAAWRELGARVTVWSRTPERAAAFARAHGVAAEGDRARVVGEAELVDVCTPTDTHARFVLEAARSGRAAYCEKPLSRRVPEAKAMIAECAEAGARLFVGHSLRYLPAYARARQAVRGGRIGALRESAFHREGGRPPRAWFADLERSGGVTLDLAIHDLDFARWVAGDVEAVSARLEDGPEGSPPNVSRVTLRHVGGATSRVLTVWAEPGTPYSAGFRLTGSAGVLTETTRFEPAPESELELELELAGVPGLEIDNPTEAALLDAASALRDGTTPRVTPADGLAALRIALTALASARQAGVRLDPRTTRLDERS